MSQVKTFFLLTILTVVLVVLGGLIGGQLGLVIAFAFAFFMNVFSWWGSDKLVISIYNAQPIPLNQMPDIHAITNDIARKAGIPNPRLYYIDNPQPNAFATGRNPQNGVVVLSTGIINLLNRDEIEGVIAHEIAHIKNRDTLIMTVAATLAGAITMLVNFLQLSFLFGGKRDNNVNPVLAIIAMILMPFVAMLIQMSISRTREYKADFEASHLSRKPFALASALKKLENYAKNIPNEAAEQNPATAHMFIINPLVRKGDSLFSTHPSTENRIEQLNQIAKTMGINQSQSNSSDLMQRLESFDVNFINVHNRNNSGGNQNKNNPWL